MIRPYVRWDSNLLEVRVSDEDVPDIYCDQMTMVQSIYGMTFTFGVSPHSPSMAAGGTSMAPRVVLRMSLEHAKTLSMLIHKNLKQYELEHLGDPIRIPRKQMDTMGLTDETW